ncbi:MAG: ferrous iron transport protein B [Methanoculleus sp.]|uniref:ferrous iron transport protein B n=3 Tax=Methanoculleus TaxID=45989 RepID=UPI0025F1B832|nr:MULTISPECIES: ferrous iron transport protein B [unclassified Methanoculleus]MCK9317807.1 ferrous iron transport protein B [Methanoculleus sp.]MDD2255096.1 ferrous iron transport protein B [Methanoculleus sp.]MDD3217290.1 ferrous iron transport protein B [Methanoculleus sp.]MDD4315392.1 ferrous iron transport protein B [Methanoculleus sp.]MDD4472011.1 ferrous iron transport protein B [Methanoculleus sp.]
MTGIRVALAGNPNVGKTTLFNALTGSRQHVGNWPGVTVEKKTGRINRSGHAIEVIDLPGTYSLTACSADEVVARDYILEERPDVVVQVVDATNLERNLYLTTQIAELGVPVVIALNMADAAEAGGCAIDRERLSALLAIPVVRTVGIRGEGLDDLLDAAVREAETPPHHEHTVGYRNDVEAMIASLVGVLEADKDLAERYPLRWLAARLLEGDENALAKVRESPVSPRVQALLSTIDPDECEAAMADRRYDVIAAVLPQVRTAGARGMNVSEMVDRVVTDRYLGIPIFLALMWGTFELTFAVAAPFVALIEAGLARLSAAVAGSIGPAWLASLVGDGIIGGVGSVLVFVPNIFILFLILSFLEDTGYLARAAFIMDRLMYAIGLPGKAFIPMLIGFGCNVPGIMAARTIEGERDRLITILVNPFISCSARLPVYILFAGAFFGAAAGVVVFLLYVLGIAAAIGSAKLFRHTILPGESSPFIMEMPPYRLPTAGTSLLHTWSRGVMYVRKAGTIILAGALVLWCLASFPFGVEYGSSASLAGALGHLLEPLVAPLGFDWKIAVALLFGFVAKEVVVGSLGVLYGAGEEGDALSTAFLADPGLSAATALALMVFVLLYTPCLATIATIRKETGSWKWAGFSVAYGLVLAWLLALIVGRIAPSFIGGA